MKVPHVPCNSSARQDTSDAQTRLTTCLPRLVAILFFIGMLSTLTYRVAQFLAEAWRAVNFRFGLDWAEGAVWQQAMLIPGPRMYGPIDVPPFLIFAYPLVYHLAVHGLVALGADPLMAGRALAVTCMLVIAGLCGYLVNRAMQGMVSRPTRLLGTAIASLIPLTYHPVTYWSQQMRVDTLAIALSFLGVTLAVLAVRRPVLLWPAVIAFVLSVYTKQVELTAPAAALTVTFIANRRPTILATFAGLAMATVALLALEWATKGGFLRHIVLGNIYPFSLSVAISAIMHILMDHVVYVALALAGLLFVWAREIRSERFRVAEYSNLGKLPRLASFLIESDLRIVLAVSTLWFVLSSIMLVTAGKAGANENYFIEAMCVWAIPIGMLVAFIAHWAFAPSAITNRSLACAFASFLAAVLLFQVKQLGPKQYEHLRDPAFAAANEQLIKDVQAADRPVYSEDPVISMRSGRGIPAAPPNLQLREEAAFARMLEEKNFAFLILQYDERSYQADVLTTIRNSYPLTEQVGPYLVRRPLH